MAASNSFGLYLGLGFQAKPGGGYDSMESGPFSLYLVPLNEVFALSPPFPLDTRFIAQASLLGPESMELDFGAVSPVITGRVRVGLVKESGPAPGLVAEIGYSLDASNPVLYPGAWHWFPAVFDADVGDYEHYRGELTIPSSGIFNYDYCLRFSLNGGSWTYADLDGSDNGYQLNEAGAIRINHVEWANLQGPAALNAVTGSPTESIYGQVFMTGLTEQGGPTDGLVAEAGFGPDGVKPWEGDWQWFPAWFDSDQGENDQFAAQIVGPAAGSYDYCLRYSYKGYEWFYGDLDGGDFDYPGYSPTQAGSMTATLGSDAMSLAISDAQVPEGMDGTTPLIFPITLSKLHSFTASVDFATSDGTASAENDYMPTSGTLELPPATWDYLSDLATDGTGDGQVNAPNGVAVGPNGEVLIADTGNNRIQKFSREGAFVWKRGTYGSGGGQFNSPRDVGVDGNGRIYVVDQLNYRIEVFQPSSEFWTAYGTQGSGNSQFRMPTGIAVGDRVYVADAILCRIQMFQLGFGVYLGQWGRSGAYPGYFNSPQGVAVDAGGNVYVADTGNNRVQKFDRDGRYITYWGSQGSLAGQFNEPRDIAVDDMGYVHVSDVGNNRIQVFDSEGHYITQWTAHGAGFRAPGGLAMDPYGFAYATYPAYGADDRVEKYRCPELNYTITVPVNGDIAYESDETFALNLSNPEGVVLDRTSATGTIRNDDALIMVSVIDTFLTEGNSGYTTAAVRAILSTAASHEVTFRYETRDGAAMWEEDDYEIETSGNAVIPAGATTTLIPIYVSGDVEQEQDEDFSVRISEPVGAEIGTIDATVWILDDETPRVLSINDASVTEGDAGTQELSLTVTLSAPRKVPVSVSWATRDSTTNNYLDYVPGSGILTIPPENTQGTITLSVVGDEYKELTEFFIVRLSEPTHATIADRDGVVTILDDGDSQFAVWMGGGSTLDEGDSGTKPAIAMVYLSAPADPGMSVTWATSDGSATVADNDYIAASGTYDIPIGASYGTLSGMQVVGDTLVEPNEYFRVNLTGATGAVITQPLGAVNIRNDDAAIPNVYWTRDSNSVTEGNSEALEVALSQRTGHEVHVYWHTVDGTATAADSDYVAASGMLIIPPNAPGADIMVSTIENALWEPTKSFQVVLTGASYAIVTDTTIVVNITDDDPLPVIGYASAASVVEGDTGTVAVRLALTLSQAMDSVVTVHFETDPGTATHYSDYLNASGTVSFAAGETAETLTVYVRGDTIPEEDETFTVEYSSPHLARFLDSDPESEITIQDDDVPWVTVNDVTVVEEYDGILYANVHVTLSAPWKTGPVEVDYFTRDGTATVAGNDYVARSGTLEFPDYSEDRTVAIVIKQDSRREPVQTFELVLANPRNCILADSICVITIVDDDPMPTLTLTSISLWEGNTVTRTATVQASLSQSTDYEVTASWQAVDGTATVSGGDFEPASGILSFAPGTKLATMDVQVNGDLAVEPQEWFTVAISDVLEADPDDTTATVTIRDDDSLPIASLMDASISEGDAGLYEVALPLSFTKKIDVPFEVTMQTTDGTATVADNDYAAVSGTVTIEPAPATFERKWGTSGTGNGQFSSPRGVAVDTGGVVYVVDTGNNRIQKFDQNGVFLSKWGSAGTGNGQFSAPEGIALDDSSNVYVVDTGNNRMQKFDKNGTFMTKWKPFLGFNGPRCAALDNAGYLYVTDYGNSKVMKYDRNGVFIKSWDKSYPYGIAFEDSSYVYLTFTSASSNRVAKYTPTFSTITSWSGSGENELDDPRGIAVSKGGGIYVVDRDHSRIEEFNGSGTFVASWGGLGSGDGQFNLPYGIAVAKNFDFYVADTGNNRIQKFSRPMTTAAACTMQVAGDFHYESDETLTVALSNPKRILLDRDMAAVTIVNDDPVPAISIAGAWVGEGNSGTTPVNLQVQLSARSAFDATVDWATEDSTAVSGADYAATSGTLTIPAGDSLATITVYLMGDIDREADEILKVALTNPVNASVSTPVALVLITDDDKVSVVQVADASRPEGDSGTAPLKFPVSLSWPIEAPASFSWETADGSASLADSDYVAASGTYAISPPTPSFMLRWGSVGSGNGAFQNPEGIAIARDGSVYVADVGNNRIQKFDPNGVFQLAWGSAGAGNGQFDAPTGVALDESTNVYVADSGNDRIQKFTSSGAYITKWSSNSGAYGVAVDDAGYVFVATGTEYMRKYSRTGTQIDGWYIGSGQYEEALGVAVDDSGYVYVVDNYYCRIRKYTNAGNWVRTWGSSGTGNGQFSSPYGIVATAGVVYVADTGNNRIQKFDLNGTFIGKWGTSGSGDGQFSAPRGVAVNDSLHVYVSQIGYDRIQKFGHGMPAADSIEVLVKGDTKYETNEAMTLTLSNPVGASLWRTSATGTILNDDAMPVVSVAGVAVAEGTGGAGVTEVCVPLSLSSASPLPVTVSFHTEDSTATVANNDYISADSTVTIPPSDTSACITVRIKTDWGIEPDEIFKMRVTEANGAAVGEDLALVTILNDDTVPQMLAISDTSVAEGDSGTVAVHLTVSLSHPLEEIVTVDFSTEDSTATAADLDFTPATGTLEIPPGDTTGVIQVLVRGDRGRELDEVFKVVLSNPWQATIEDSVGIVTILNDDDVPAVHIAEGATVEGDAGVRAVTLPVSLSYRGGLPVTVRWHTVDGTAAAADTDYVAVSDSLLFAPGDSLKFASVGVRGDRRAERDETFRVVLSSATGAIIADTSASVLVANDDLPILTIADVSVTEGSGGTTPALVVMGLSGPVSHDVTVAYRTQDSTATSADADYVVAIDTLLFPAGAVAETLTVLVNGDTLYESDETFWVVLWNPGGTVIGDSIGVISILNDDAVTGIEDRVPVRDFALLPPWPNPTSGSAVHFQFELPRQDHVRLFVYDVAGREVTRLVDARYALGRHRIEWNCRRGDQSIATGVYFVRFSSGGRNFVRRVVLIR